ncbi:branched-chain amino acid ABC transporter permease [Nitratireductor basaltis]|uniref:Inner-membrane translocator n=1 Tax=Nitratireductor basaltis TaxID=472175 RepID=A0A084U5L4_9HYPH|nr:branched-chain amino acid ABC transporter permease [Nitratireductor basaltis]KFB08250.1 Inner-membrane translocator [Nitratireductor basaltis]
MDQLVLQLLNGLDKGGAYALIALGLTLVFGTLGVVNFAHGALFMIGAFCAVVFSRLIQLETVTVDPDKLTPWGSPMEIRTPLVQAWLGDFGAFLVQWSVPLSILIAIPVMLLIGIAMERGLIRFFYRRPHAEQILVTFGLAIVLQELVKANFGANPIPMSAPSALAGSADVGAWLGFPGIYYPWWRLVYLAFAFVLVGGVMAFLRFTTYGMVVRAGMEDRQTVGFLGIDIQKRFTVVFGIAAVVAGLAGVMYTPIVPPNYHIGMDFLVLSFVVVVVGGMGSVPGAVFAGFLLGILQSFASMNEVKSILPGIDQVIIYLVAVVVLLVLPRGLMGRKGVMEN